MSSNPIVQGRLEVIGFHHSLFLRAVGDNLTSRSAVFQIAEGGSHILWLVGHMAWSYDFVMRSGFNGEPSVLPADWASQFGIGTKPVGDPSKYPSLAATLDALGKANAAAMSFLATVPDSKLPEDLPATHPLKGLFRTYNGFFLAATFHQAYHTGQVAMIKRSLGLPSWMSA
jgi:hypothetical protein